MPKSFRPQPPANVKRALSIATVSDETSKVLSTIRSKDSKEWARICEELEQAGKVKLSEADRGFVWLHFSSVLAIADAATTAPSVVQRKKTFRKISELAAELCLTFEELEKEPHFDVVPILREYSDNWDDFDRLPSTLRSLVNASNRVLGEFKTHTQGRAGRGRIPGFEFLVLRLADVFERAGGRPSAAYSVNYAKGGRRLTPFVRFLKTLLKNSPEKLPFPQSDSAIGSAVFRALSVRKNLMSKRRGGRRKT